MEQFMQSEHFGIFPEKLVTKNVVFVSSRTHLMHAWIKSLKKC